MVSLIYDIHVCLSFSLVKRHDSIIRGGGSLFEDCLHFLRKIDPHTEWQD